MGDPRDDYRDAMKRCDEARAAATQMVKLIKQAADSFSGYKIATTLAVNFNMVTDGAERRLVRDIGWDVASWPDQAKMRAVFNEWHQAFLQVHAAWSRVPEADRAVARRPPEKMDLD